MNTRFSDSLQWADWCSKIPSYESMDRNQKKKAKKRYKMQTGSMNECCLVSSCSPAEPTPCVTLSNYTFAGGTLEIRTTEKEKAMDTTTIYDIEEEKRSYLRNRLSDIHCQKASKLEKDFGLVDDEAPRTPQEFVDRIKSGMVTFPDDEVFAKMNDGWSIIKPGNILRWRDPAMKEDKDGYWKAITAFEATETPVYDAIAILDPKDALAAVQAHEQATLH